MFYRNSRSKDGRANLCKPCRKKEQQLYRKTEKGKATDRRYNNSDKRIKNLYAYWDRNSDKKYAQTQLSNAIRDGKIIKDSHCQCCNTIKVEGHHWSYEKCNVLDVFWLCKSCHTKEHEMIKVKGYPEYRKLYIEDKNT